MLGCDIILAAIIAASPADDAPPVCAANDWSLAVARTQATADNYLLALEEGRDRFRTVFGQDTPRSAIVQGNAAFASASASLTELGYSSAFPGIDHQEQNEMMAEQIRNQIVSAGADPDSPSVAAQIDQILSGRASEAPTPEMERGILSHEFGHIWFLLEIWQDDATNSQGGGASSSSHYGGSAADWLDEMVAVALENEELTDSRWQRLRQDNENDDGLALSQFFTMQHPSAAIARQVASARVGEMPPPGVAGAEGTQAVTRAVVLTGADARRVIANSESNPLTYYAMARGMLDYLQERGGDGILPAISTALRNGSSLEDWLASDGTRFNLPGDMPALEADWNDWIANKI